MADRLVVFEIYHLLLIKILMILTKTDIHVD